MKRRIAPFEIPTSLLSLLLLAHLVSPVPLRAATEDPIPSLTRSADFIFRGTVKEVGASNVSLIAADSAELKTAIVRVDELLKASGALDDFAGWDITVVSTEALRPGESRVFFTSVRFLGESLGVAEVGRADGKVVDLARWVRRAHLDEQRNHLAARFAAAEVAVSGRIVETRAPQGAGSFSEHDPQWREAVLSVRSVLKGTVTEKKVSFLYPGSFDVLWAEIPKPKVGQVGTWLLHRSPNATKAPGKADLLVVGDPGDLLSATEAVWAKTLSAEEKP